MTTQEYLGRIARCENMIRLKSEEIARMDSLICSTPPTAMNPDKVQSSMVGDRMSDAVVKLVDSQENMRDMISGYLDLKNKIISEIESLPDIKSVTVLYGRYVLHKSNCEIACDPCLNNCSERRVKQLHRKALDDFKEKYGEKYEKMEISY